MRSCFLRGSLGRFCAKQAENCNRSTSLKCLPSNDNCANWGINFSSICALLSLAGFNPLICRWAIKASKPAMAFLALASQEKSGAWILAWAFIRSINSGLDKNSTNLFVMDSVERGSNKASSKFTTSGKLEVLEEITAAPHFMASSAGKPKPSCQEGKTKSLQV